jgi:hypothetical protein
MTLHYGTNEEKNKAQDLNYSLDIVGRVWYDPHMVNGEDNADAAIQPQVTLEGVMTESTFSLRDLDPGVQFQIIQRADELLIGMGGLITKAEAVARARAEIARGVPRMESRSMFKRVQCQKGG